MAKKVYHIPLQDARLFMHEHKAVLNRLLSDKQFLEYAKRFGKGYYDAQIEAFVTFFKIDKDLGYALKTINHFSAESFLDDAYKLLNFSQYVFEKHKCSERNFFYGFCYVFEKENPELFHKLMQKFFLHFHESLNSDSNITINYQEMAKSLAVSRKLTLKESFGEDEKGAFFQLLLTKEPLIVERGKSIKTLRKKAYKKLFFYLINQDENSGELERIQAYETLENIKAL
ncbi:MAG: hypothetical protein U9R50_06965 [Campylobacterota bacterium]|nr:hypothetical protein [Campylobacterota bacterium]